MLSLNFIGTAFLALVMANLYIQAQLNAPQAPEVHVMTPPLAMGKERSFSSGRDASMFTQQVRRQAVVNGHYGSPNLVLRESNHTSGFTNGVLEIYSITGICQRVCAALEAVVVVCSPVLDGGNAATDNCQILDGNGGGSGGVVLDAGNAQTVVC
jgi:hypothetical protein